MPEPSILFTVTGVVIVGLAAWLAMVLKKANEPWARTANADMVVAAKAAEDPPVEPVVEAEKKTSEPKVEAEAPKSEPKVEAEAPKSEPKVEAEAPKSEPKVEAEPKVATDAERDSKS